MCDPGNRDRTRIRPAGSLGVGVRKSGVKWIAVSDSMEALPFQVGDRVRVVRIPPHIDNPQYPHAVVKRAFAAALGNIYRVEDVDWGGWVWLFIDDTNGAIGIQPDCVERVKNQT